MPADASIYSLIRPAAQTEGPLDSYGKALTLRNLMDQQGLHDLQRRKMEQEMADDEGVRQFYAGIKPGENPRQRVGDLLRVSPKAGMAAQKFYADADKNAADLAFRRMETISKATGILKDRLPTVRDEVSYQQYRETAAQLLGPDMVQKLNLPGAFDPNWVRNQMVKAEELFTPKPQEMDLGGKRVVVDMNPFTNPSIVGSNFAKTMTPGERDTSARGWASNAETIRSNRERESGAGRQYDPARGVIVDTRGGTASPVMVGGNEFGGGKPLGADPSKAREDLDSLRKEFATLPEVKNYKDVVPIINAAKAAPNTPAGDFALIYGVGKILDPGSVVREGEMSLVIKSGSPAERVNGYLQYLQGNGRLTPALRQQLNAMLDTRVSEMASSYNAAKGTYEGIAKNRGYNTDEIFSGIPALAQGSPAAPAATQKPTQAEIDAELRRRGVIR